MHRLVPLAFTTVLLAGHAAVAQPLVTSDWLKTHLADPHVVLLDIRPGEQHAAGHIRSAVSADFDTAGWRVKQSDGAGGALPPIDQIAATIAGWRPESLAHRRRAH
jgi:3-mercaptopyruvate sulfurtransferase SseA